MIELALAGLLAFATVPAASPEPMVEQVQFRAAPGGRCPDGYDYNHSNGRCYPNDYHAPGVYTRNPGPHEYYGRQRGGGLCPHGYDYNYSNGSCYPNGAHGPGAYGRPEAYGRRGGLCPDGYDYNYSRGQCYPNGARVPGMYGR
ncbi:MULTISPECIES: hypothetical protein [Bradyrhizobium]|uniref:hypothetical protein n=1 Tax=Bradyrhizobium TaxID=374 RepID=UPI001BA6B2A2|nr:hypothetical protein [Bradyrhizobium liaoningense]MBR0986568.1 hypothetical protein [Bradyrhizobium liaoningense]GMO29145.1 hypothetical protein TM233_41060 [Bradyrhizobium sp. TM233]GMP02812.1 hypothetical protein TM239_32880 [Bradyrhizobium sp. TM239]